MKNTIPKKYIPYLNLLPLTIFLMYARFFGFTDQAWQGAFIIAGIFAACVTTYLLFQSIIIDRLMLGVNLFFFIGPLAFIGNIEPILEFYGTYKGTAFFSSIVIIGFITTFFSSTGFIGIKHKNKFTVNTASYGLLIVSIVCLAQSFFLNNYGLFISTACPFIGLRLAQNKLIKKLKSAY